MLGERTKIGINMAFKKHNSLSESPAGDIFLLSLKFHGCKFEIRNCGLVEWFFSKELLELFLDPLLVFLTGSRVPAIKAIELKRLSR